MFVSKLRNPNAIVLVNGVQVSWIDVEVNNNGFHQADSFRVTVSLKKTKELHPEIDRAWWRAQNPICVEVYMGEGENIADLTLLIVGNVDDLPHDMVRDTVTLYGRDYTSFMIDTKISTNSYNLLKASDLAIKLAKKYELKTDFITPTKNFTVGSCYRHNYTKMNKATTEWNVLCFLAAELGYEVFVRGKQLHFHPPLENPPIYTLEWRDEDEQSGKQFYGQKLVCTRNMTIAKDIVVNVRALNLKGKPYSKPFRADHTKDRTLNRGHRYIGSLQVMYQVIHRAMSLEELEKEGNRILREVSQHQVKLIADGIPADNILTPQHLLRLVGTGIYDQDFHPDSIIRSLSLTDGWKMNITAKNHDPNTVMPI